MMDESPAIDIRVLTHSDIAAGMRLKELARWNQTEEDWNRLLRLEPAGCFCATINGEVVGTVTTTTYDHDLAWIGMVLVHPDYRRQGIGKRLMHAALAYLGQAGIATVKLDATPEGRPVYEAIGFKVESRIERWQGIAETVGTPNCTPISGSAPADMLKLDRTAFVSDRSKLIETLIEDAIGTALTTVDGSLQGYAIAREGSNATYIGPLVARDGLQAEQLLDCLFQDLTGEQVYIDVNTKFDNATGILSRRGLNKQREFDRMVYGKHAGSTSRLVFAIAGPELG
jgi:ribosomal protein S18 acetylase RimI-like enzyme